MKTFEQHSQDARVREVRACPTIGSTNAAAGCNLDPLVVDSIAVFKIRGGGETYTKPDGKTGTAGKGLLMSDEAAFTVSVAQDQQLLDGGFVRRLTPTECETLQGFPRGWTDVPYRGAPASDAARFKGLGNSWATNCAEWILRRLVASDVFKE